MSIVYNKYINRIDHTWYDSSNIVYSQCFDNAAPTKSVKIVFKGGRTYLYKDVDPNDYVLFRTSESTGKAANDHIIKKYQAVRLSDTDLEKLEEMKLQFMEETNETSEVFSNLAYTIEINQANGDFRLLMNGKPIYEAVEGQVSIINLLKSMSIAYSIVEMEKPLLTETDFETNNIVE